MRVQKKAESSTSGKLPATKNVLIAAHDVRVAGLIEEYLSETGYEARCELNLDAVLQALLETNIDLLIVDGEMPEKVLSDFVEAVARMKPGLPIIAVGMSEHETRSGTLSAFVSAFVEKPFSISDISNTINEVQTQFPTAHSEGSYFGDGSLKLRTQNRASLKRG